MTLKGGRPGPCGRCGARIVWARTMAGPNGPGGKMMPLDAEPDPRGNVAVHPSVTGQLQARVLAHDDALDELAEERAMPHFATCGRDHAPTPVAGDREAEEVGGRHLRVVR